MLKADQRSSPRFRLQFRGRSVFVENHLTVTAVLSVSFDMNLPEAQSFGTDVIMLFKRRGDFGILAREQSLKSEVEPSRSLDDSAAIEDASVEVAQRIHLEDWLSLIKILGLGADLFPELDEQLQVRRLAAEPFLAHQIFDQ